MKAAVLGSPIEHSLSPLLHAAGYDALGLADWSYQRFEVRADELAGFVAALDASWRGLSLTMPLKRACLEVATTVSPEAALAGVGNTLVRIADGWLADNTDIAGVVDALRPHWQPGWTEAAVLGSGATARSAVLALSRLGARTIRVHARDLGRAAALADWAQLNVTVKVEAAPLLGWNRDPAPVVASTLPAGVADQLLPISGAELIFDVVYADWPTPLAQAGYAAGRTVVSGLDLLVAQAARQFELFTGCPAPRTVMLAAGRNALQGAS